MLDSKREREKEKIRSNIAVTFVQCQYLTKIAISDLALQSLSLYSSVTCIALYLGCCIAGQILFRYYIIRFSVQLQMENAIEVFIGWLFE